MIAEVLNVIQEQNLTIDQTIEKLREKTQRKLTFQTVSAFWRKVPLIREGNLFTAQFLHQTSRGSEPISLKKCDLNTLIPWLQNHKSTALPTFHFDHAGLSCFGFRLGSGTCISEHTRYTISIMLLMFLKP